MKRLICISVILCFLCFEAWPQVVSTEIQVGTGTYSMKDLKNMNRLIKKAIVFDTKTVDNFPPFLNYSAILKIHLNNVSLGLIYMFQTTGSRISGKDYSGEYYFDMTVNASIPGVFGEFLIPTDTRLNYSLFSAFGLLLSSLKMHEYLNVLAVDGIDDRSRFKARNFYLYPGFSICYPIGPVKLGLNAGYSVQFGKGSFFNCDNVSAKLINPNSGDGVKPGWSGLRTGLSAAFTFPVKKR